MREGPAPEDPEEEQSRTEEREAVAWRKSVWFVPSIRESCLGVGPESAVSTLRPETNETGFPHETPPFSKSDEKNGVTG
jgi:hypothetical protein